MTQAKMLYPENRLAGLLLRPGGRLRARAVDDAARQVETARDLALTAIETGIVALETMPLAPDSLEMMGRTVDRIVSLALTFGLAPLAETAMRLCDLAQIYRVRCIFAPEPLRVHLRALRLFAPANPPLAPAHSAAVLAEIAALLAHLR